MTRRVAVVTDSSACIPPALAKAWGVHIVPLHVNIDGVPHVEGEAGLDDQVVDAVRSGLPVKTAQPNVEACRAVFERAAQDADAVVAIGLSHKISGTVGSMQKAAANTSVPVTVLNSRSVSWGAGFAALSAAAVAREGGDAAAVANEAERVARSALVLFTVETLAHLKAGGRISPAVAALGTALSIRLILGITGGEIVSTERVRTAAKARAALVARIASRAPTFRNAAVGIVTLAGDEQLSEDTRFEIFKRGAWPTVHSRLSAVLGAHTGPGTLGVIAADVHPAVREALAASRP